MWLDEYPAVRLTDGSILIADCMDAGEPIDAESGRGKTDAVLTDAGKARDVTVRCARSPGLTSGWNGGWKQCWGRIVNRGNGLPKLAPFGAVEFILAHR